MLEAGWQHRYGAAPLALFLLLALGAGQLLAVRRSVDPPAAASQAACGSATQTAALAASWSPAGSSWTAVRLSEATGSASQPAKGAPWYRLEDRADRSGTLIGYTLEAGVLAAPSVIRRLPAESFGAGPFGSAVLFGEDDGARSELHLVRLDDGCQGLVLAANDIVRRATLDPTGTFVYYHLLDRSRRADRGIWRRSLADDQPAEQVMPPVEATTRDDPFGPTFSTEFHWSLDGSLLAVQSCDAFHCRTRVLQPGTGEVRVYEMTGIGELLGLTDRELVAYEACRGLPCPIVAIDLATGESRSLTAAAGIARLAADGGGEGGGEGVVFEAVDATEYRLEAVNLATGVSRQVHAGDGRLRLVGPPSRSGRSLAVPRGWVELTSAAGAARGPIDGSRLLRIADGMTVDVTEVTQ